MIGGGRVLFVGVVEDGGDHNDQVLDVSDPVKEVGGNPEKKICYNLRSILPRLYLADQTIPNALMRKSFAKTSETSQIKHNIFYAQR